MSAPVDDPGMREECVTSLLRMARLYAEAFGLNAYDLLSEACTREQTSEAEAWSDRKADA